MGCLCTKEEELIEWDMYELQEIIDMYETEAGRDKLRRIIASSKLYQTLRSMYACRLRMYVWRRPWLREVHMPSDLRHPDAKKYVVSQIMHLAHPDICQLYYADPRYSRIRL